MKALADWNHSLPADKKISVQSADIEVKQESVILALNLLMEERIIPEKISMLETFRIIYKEKEQHRNKFESLNVLYYYDKKKCMDLVKLVNNDLEVNPDGYKNFFRQDLDLFRTMMTDLLTLYKFDYKKKQTMFKFRDDIIYQKLLDLAKIAPDGFLYVVGAQHARENGSSFKLKTEVSSPLKDKVLLISTTGKNKSGNYLRAKDVTKISAVYPELFYSGDHIIIKNDGRTKFFTQSFDYTLALRDNKHVTPFSSSYKGKLSDTSDGTR